MRYHSARVVFGACLIAAASAAQAPASFPGSLFPGDGGASGGGTPESRTTRANERPDDPQPRFGSGLRSFDLPQGQGGQGQGGQGQGAVDYSLPAMFRQQHGDFMDRRERYTPDVEVRGRWYPNQRINHEPGSFDEFQYDFDARMPIVVSPDGYLTFGAYYGARRYVTSDAFGTAGNGAGNGIGDETLISTGLTVGFGVFLSDNVLFEVESHPGIWSDMDDHLHHEDYDFPSEAIFTIRTIDNFFFKVGARYNQVYEEAPWLPYLGFSWEVMEGLRIDVLAPETAEVSWWPSASYGFLFGAFVSGAEYHVRTSEATGSQRGDTQVQEVVTYLGLMTRFNDHTSLSLRGGLVVAGDYDMTTGAAGFNNAEGALDQGVYAEASFGFSF